MVVDQMGSKTAARELAIACDVPIIPGSEGIITELSEAQAFCDEFGFPVMVKAAFGGGGRGMRIVYNQELATPAHSQPIAPGP